MTYQVKNWFQNVPLQRYTVVFGKRRLIRRFISSVPILAALPMQEQALVAESMKEALYNQGDVIIAQGDRPDFFFVLEVWLYKLNSIFTLSLNAPGFNPCT
jgi:hypothetical protein